MSFAEGFRTLQAVRDLRILAALAPVEARARIAAGIPNGWMAPEAAQTALEALAEGHAISPDVRTETFSAVRDRAALPRDDFSTFLFANYLLLIEVLGGRAPYLEVEHHWSTYREHYRSAAAVERAAIGQALRRISLTQEIEIARPEIRADRTTASAAALKPLLEAHLTRKLTMSSPTEPSSVAALLINALSRAPAAREASDLWAEHGETFIDTMPEEVLAGFRHVYEAWEGFAPEEAPFIPLLDPPPGVEWPH